MIDAPCFMIDNDGFTTVASGSIPAVGWLKRVVHDQSEGALIKDTGVEHLSIPWFKDSQFLKFSGKQDHGQDEEREGSSSMLSPHGGGI